MTKMFKRSALIAAVLAPLFNLSGQALAAPLYWDINGTTDGAGGASPGGSFAGSNWNSDPLGGAAGTVGTFVTGSTAVFAAGSDANGAYTVNLPAAVTAGGLVVEDGGTVSLTTSTLTTGANPISVGAGATLITDTNTRISTTAGSVLTLNGTLTMNIVGSAGTFFDQDTEIALAGTNATLSYTTAGVLNIVQTASKISGTNLTKGGAGVLAFANAGLNTYTGSTTVAEGELRIRAANVLPATTPLIVNSGAVFNLNGLTQTVASLTGSGNVGTGTGTLTISGATSTSFDGALKNIANAGAAGVTTGNGKLIKTGAGVITFNGLNDINGSVTLSSATGTGGIIVSSGASLCGPVADIVVNSGTLTLNNAAQTIENLSGTGGTIVLATGHVLTSTPTSSATTFAGKITGNGAFTRTVSTGILTLSGDNTYSGATTLNGSRFNLAATTGQALGGTASVALNTTSILSLGVSNQINNAAPMSFNGGTFSTAGFSEGSFDGLTGAGVAGLGAATLANDSIIDLGLNASGSIVAFADSSLATWAAGKTLKIYNWTGNPTLGGGFDRLFVGSNAAGLTADQLAQVQFFQGVGTNLLGAAMQLPTGEIVPVPEPTSLAALGLGAVAFFGRRRKA